MAEDVVKVVNEMGKQEGMQDGIQFHNIHHESTLSDLYVDKVGHKDNDSCASDKDWKNRKNPQDNLKILASYMDVDNDEVDDLVDDLNNEYAIHLNDKLGDVEGFAIDKVQHEEDNRQHHFDVPIENEGEQHNHFGGPDQENVIADHDINFDGDADENNNRNDINLIQDDTNESFHTTEADHDDTEDLSDEDDNDEANVISNFNLLIKRTGFGSWYFLGYIVLSRGFINGDS